MSNYLSELVSLRIISRKKFGLMTERMQDLLTQTYRTQRINNKSSPSWVFNEPAVLNTLRARFFSGGTNLAEAMDVLAQASCDCLTWVDVIQQQIDLSKIDLAVYINALKYFLVKNRIKCAYLTKMYINEHFIDFDQRMLCLNKKDLELSTSKKPRVYFRHVCIENKQVSVDTNM